MAVSYTHLDVYKRQEEHRAMLEQQAWIGLMDQARADNGSEGLRNWWKNQNSRNQTGR